MAVNCAPRMPDIPACMGSTPILSRPDSSPFFFNRREESHDPRKVVSVSGKCPKIFWVTKKIFRIFKSRKPKEKQQSKS